MISLGHKVIPGTDEFDHSLARNKSELFQKLSSEVVAAGNREYVDGLNYWRRILDESGDYRSLSRAFLESDEYQKR